MRMWDTRTSHAPDVMVANSTFIRAQIRRIYGRDAEAVFPPVEVPSEAFSPYKDDYYVTASFLAPYKRTDLAIPGLQCDASPSPSRCRRWSAIAGLACYCGAQRHFYRFPATPILFEYHRARARDGVFAGCEDFGIALAEAQALGTPLIAFGRGGARDIVAPFGEAKEPTGLLFDRQEERTLINAIAAFESSRSAFRPHACRERADLFSTEQFDLGMKRAFEMALEVQRSNTASGGVRPIGNRPAW